ncbi:MAG: MtrB/PioB family outer membrane beta-barrel protein [Leptothrix sp. (in: b-proteobacteria)]
MKTHRNFLRLRTSVLAVNGALALMGMAYADSDPTVAELTQPASKIEVGVGQNSSASVKAHEFDGVSRKGAYALGGFELLGGGAYDSDSARRWRISGTDLGLQSRSLKGEYGVQGSFKLKFNYDELLRNRSDTYQTPYLGIGTNQLSLPSTWRVPVVPQANPATPNSANARGLSPAVTSAAAIPTANGTLATAKTPTFLTNPPLQQVSIDAVSAAQAADLPAFRLVKLSTKREQVGLGSDVQLGAGWSASVSGSHEHKDGLTPFSAISRITGGDISATLAQPVDQDHNQYRLALNYAGEGATLQAAYDASLFTNNIASVGWSVWADPTKLQSMGTAPSNQFHKLSLAGSYDVDPATKVIGKVAYSRATQNERYLNDGLTTVPLLPEASLNGLVVSESVNLKVLNKTTKDLRLSAAYKFDLRDNRTPVNTYGFYDVGESRAVTNTGALTNSVFGTAYGTNINLNANRPYSKRVNQLSLDADYRLQPGQQLNFGLDSQNTDKYCTGSWIDCSDAAKSTENTLKAAWQVHPTDEISTRVGLEVSRRRVEYNEDAFLSLVPMANVSPSGAPNSATAYGTMAALGLTGYGPISGLAPAATAGSAQAFFFANNNALTNSLYANANRISELVGMRRYNNANRDRNKLRTSANWQATETFSLQGGFDYSLDNYSESVYGLQRASNWAINLDGTYAPSEDLSLSVFYSRENQTSRSAGNSYTPNSTATNVGGATQVVGGCYADLATRNANNKVDPCLNWSATTRERNDTLGATLSKNRLLATSLDVTGSLIFSQARTDMNVKGGNYVNNPYAGSTVAGAVDTAVAAYYIAATPLPTVKVNSLELRLGGNYHLNKDASVRVGYGYQRLSSSDWAYDAMQPGGLSGVLPTSEQAFHYSVRNIGVAYLMTLR